MSDYPYNTGVRPQKVTQKEADGVEFMRQGYQPEVAARLAGTREEWLLSAAEMFPMGVPKDWIIGVTP
jgi:hypothetical protein